MLCEICHTNEATIHIQEIVNSKKTSLHICGECASRKSKENFVINGLNLAEILYNISSQMPAHQKKSSADGKTSGHAQLVCEKCGWDSSQISEKGRLGCSECYNVFRDILSAALKNMHKGTLHVGKRPGARKTGETSQRMMEIMNLQKQLEECILREEYEKAAEIRDKLNDFKKKNKKIKNSKAV